jgi:UDP-N-acetyl-D-glucosamine dehydrogenase
MATLEERIIARDATIAVLGLGYVGLPLAVDFAQSGFTVSGVDLDAHKVATLNAGGSYVADVPAALVAPLVRQGRLHAVTDYAQVACPRNGGPGPDVIFICVPTPYTGAKVPDLSYIEAAARSIAAHLAPEQLIVLESTTYPGTTEELVQPLLERSGLSAARDFYLAFSPERINPGDRHFGVHNTPKVAGGTRPEATHLAKVLFEAASPSGVFAVSSPRAAEMAKLLENTFRAVNIALVNELALLAERMGVDIWEVIDAASTKPFGYMRFTPGPGVGGHCIPVDPFYLSWKAREYDFYTRFIEHAAAINESMPFHLYSLVAAALNQQGVAVPNARVLVLGVAFKPNVDDYRNSPARRFIELLREHGADVRYHDPHVPVFPVAGQLFAHQADGATLHSVELSEDELRTSDAVIIAIGHDGIDYDWVVRHARLVVDAVNATRGCAHNRARIRRLGAPPGK